MILFLKDNLVINSQAIAWCKIVYRGDQPTNKLEIHFNGADAIDLECKSVGSAKHISKALWKLSMGQRLNLLEGVGMSMIPTMLCIVKNAII